MKKYLYGTTILAAVGLATGPVLAEETPIHLELGGGYNEYFGFGSADKADNTATKIAFVSHEVHFKIRGELPNGLVIGGAIELEGESGGDNIDQAYVNLSGGFGLLRLGGINSGRYSMAISSPNAGLGSDDGSQSVFMTNTTGAPATNTDLSGDAQKITYFTPRFNGIQLAASYAPTGDRNRAGNDPGLTVNNEDYSSAWDFGASYKGDFNEVSISAMLGVGGANAPNLNDVNGNRFDDFLLWNAGLSLSGGGFTVSGAITEIAEGQINDAGTISTEGTDWTIGVKYATGPWAVSASFTDGEREGLIATAGDDEAQTFAIGASYQMGPGLKASLTYLHGETDDEAGGAAANNDGDGIIAGIHIGF